MAGKRPTSDPREPLPGPSFAGLPAYEALMQHCWDQAPERRPDFTEVIQRLRWGAERAPPPRLRARLSLHELLLAAVLNARLPLGWVFGVGLQLAVLEHVARGARWPPLCNPFRELLEHTVQQPAGH